MKAENDAKPLEWIETRVSAADRARIGAAATARHESVARFVQPDLALVTDNGAPLRAFRFEPFIASHPELRHVRVKSSGQTGSGERGFESLKYERLYQHETEDGLDLARQAEDYRIE